MAVEAIHGPDSVLRGVVLEISGAVFGDFAGGIGETNPGDDLPLFVAGDVLDLILGADVPVNAVNVAFLRVTAADLQTEAD